MAATSGQTGKVGAILCRYGRPRLAPAGEVLFREGDPGEAMFLVERGTVRLEIEGGWRTIRVGPDETFGELSLVLPGHRRTGTAVAETEVRLVVLTRQALQEAALDNPRAAFSLLSGAAATLLDSERRLVASLRRRGEELEVALRNLRRVTAELDAAERRALTDSLTGMYNRRALERHIQLLVSEKTGPGGVLLLVDLDRFKEINDTHGHAAGDQALRHLAGILGDVCRPADLAFRLGGDEFALVVVGSDEEAGRRVGRRLVEAARATPVRLPTGDVHLSLSVGGTRLRPGDDWEAAMRQADAALYAAKEAGRGCFRWLGPPGG